MRIAFGDVVFDSDERSVTRSGAPLHLSPKAFDLLMLLIAERPRAVRKEEIVDALWPEVFVEEANVRNLVAEVRGALGKESARPIVTLPRIGYAFRGETKPLATAAPYVLVANGNEFPLDHVVTLVGRGDDCGVIVHASGVSRHHLRITIDGRGARVEDLASKNGTWLNGTKLTGIRELRDGDEICAGRAVMQFRSGEGASATTTLELSAPGRSGA